MKKKISNFANKSDPKPNQKSTNVKIENFVKSINAIEKVDFFDILKLHKFF